MVEINVIQGSQQWLDIRKKLITASDISCILGKSKYKNKSDLLNEKINDNITKIATGPAIDYGHRYEPIAETYIQNLKVLVSGKQVFLNTQQYLMVLVYGIIDSKNKLLEIKCFYSRKL